MMYEVQCNNCLQLQRVEYVVVPVAAGMPKWCAFCGATDIKQVIIDSYWYDLSQSLGFGRDNDGADFTQHLYGLWEAEEFSHFRDFVDSIRTQAVN